MRRFILPALTSLATLAACQQPVPAQDAPPSDPSQSSQPTGQTMPLPIAVTDETTRYALVPGNNRFAWSLYDALGAKPGNVFVSPASVSGAFALLYPGAAGETAEHMAALFGYDAVPAEVFPAAERSLSQAVLSETDKAKLTVANAVWLREGSELQAGYRDAVQNVMLAKVALVDFTKPAPAAKLINSWVEDHTNDKIHDLIPPSAIRPGLTELILTNAVWFKADWESPFKAEATDDGTFHAPDGDMTAKLMKQTLKHARYLSRDGYAALDLDYAGDDYALTVILPDAQDGLADIAKTMTPDSFTALLADMDTAVESRVHVVLPKVKIEADYNLNDAMIALGLGDAFSGNANFSRLIEGAGPGDLLISQVLHKTFLDIDEKGTEAAAATAIIMERAMAMPPQDEPIEFRADHPFLIVLRHKPTGMVMFMGRVDAPPAAED
ncbi:MAG: serpin family protein [Hyphomonas sp.]|nr:serpin family protein [Hyphomonas sp.]MCA8903953.1 serpin family protein [Hyphomonas sp.]MCB9962983.1 serpin family protein [Hyphomonas sp.]MCB9972332.1 serpin family protein [Hyphomonas sp.]